MYISSLYQVLGIQLVIFCSMKSNSDFSNAKVGDKVTDLILGHGYITGIDLEDSFL